MCLLCVAGCGDATPEADRPDAATETREDASVMDGDASARDAAASLDADRDGGEVDAGPTWPTDWPAFGGVSAGTAPIHADLAAPGYLEWTVDPRTVPPHMIDGRVPTEIARITDATIFGLPGTTTFLAAYAKVSPWNADGSRAVVFYDDDGPTRALLLDGRTFEYIRGPVPDLYPDGRWSNSRPNVWIGTRPEAHFFELDVSTGTQTTFKDFRPEYDRRTDSSLFGGEGNASNDDRIWAFHLRRATGEWEFVIWDSVADTVLGRIPTPRDFYGQPELDWWSISQNGEFFVTLTNRGQSWMSGSTRVPEGINVWSLSGELLRSNAEANGHLDLCLDSEGRDVIGFMSNKYESNDKIAQTWRLDGSDGTGSTDQMPNGYIGWAYHINCRATSRPGFMVLASSPARPPSDYNVFPLWNHLTVLRLDGSGVPAIVANTHHSEGGEAINEYYRAPFAPSNRDLTAMMFVADWDRGTSNPTQLYVVRAHRP